MEYYKRSAFGKTVATLCFDFFNNLPKTGKPKSNEWTVLACIVKSVNGSDLEVISLGTGSKCIGKNQMSAQGDVLNDSHAEVMARRGFIRYLYDQIELATQSKTSIMSINSDGKFSLLSHIDFHFFSSQSPCGDASIIMNTKDEEIINSDEDSTIVINKTGAKCITKDIDPSCDYNTPILGQVRKKPGKGDPTLSVSCSDKLARWIRLGFQGALLDTLLRDPITVKSIIIGNDIPFSDESVCRALFKRNKIVDEEINNDNIIPIYEPKILHSNALFGYRKDPDKQACDSSIVWCKVKERSLEIAVAGRKQGVTKKNISKYSSCLKISKKSLFTKYIAVLKLLNSSNETTDNIDLPFVSDNKTYKEMKNESLRYYKKWSTVKQSFFGVWCEKPDILNFTSDI